MSIASTNPRHIRALSRVASWSALGVLTIAVVIGTMGYTRAADIRVYSGGGAQPILRALAPDFEARTGHRVVSTFALVTDIQQKLADGDSADLVLLPVPLLAATEKVRPLRPEGRMLLGRVGIGVIVASSAKHPDISSPEAVSTMLLRARKIALPGAGVPTGAHLTRMIANGDSADSITRKLTYKAAIDGGVELVATGDADVGLYLLSEVQAAKGISIVGLLPPPFQNFVVYAAALPADAAAPEAALAFLSFISDPVHRNRWRAAGFESID